MNDYMSKPITQLREIGYVLTVSELHSTHGIISELWTFRHILNGNTIEFNTTNKIVGFNGHFELEEMRILMGVIELWGLL